MNTEKIKSFIEKFGETQQQRNLTADQRVIFKATYRYESNTVYPSGEVAWIYVNDSLAATIVFPGDPEQPKSQTIEMDITNLMTAGGYNGVTFETTVLNNLLGFDIETEAEFSLKVRGRRIVKEKYETKAELRGITDSWAFVY